MNRREVLRLMGVGAAVLYVPTLKAASKERCAALTITRPNFDVVHLHDDETLSSVKHLEAAFQDIDVDVDDFDNKDWDVVGRRFKRIKEHCGQIESITTGRKFLWAGWITGNGWSHRTRFHLFLMGQDDHRFNYRSDKVCMWERRMYSGDGMGGQLAKFEFADGLVLHGNCDRYWCSQIGNKPAQRYRYTLATEIT